MTRPPPISTRTYTLVPYTTLFLSVVEGFEVLADDTLAAVVNLIPGACCPTATRSPWYVLIEVDLDSAEGPSAHERLETALAAAFTKGLIQDAAIADTEAQAAQFWRLRESLYEARSEERRVGKECSRTCR